MGINSITNKPMITSPAQRPTSAPATMAKPVAAAAPAKDSFQPLKRIGAGAAAVTVGLVPSAAVVLKHGPVGGLVALGGITGAVTAAATFKAGRGTGEALKHGAKAGAIAGAATGVALAATMGGAAMSGRLAVIATNAALGALAGTMASAVQKGLR